MDKKFVSGMMLALTFLLIAGSAQAAMTMTNYRADFYYPGNTQIRSIPGYEYSFQGNRIDFNVTLQDVVSINNSDVRVLIACPQGTISVPLAFRGQTFMGFFVATYSASFTTLPGSQMQGLCTLAVNATQISNPSNTVYSNLSAYTNMNDLLANADSPPYMNISLAPQLSFPGAKKGQWNNATPYPVVVTADSARDREGQGVIMDFSLLIPNLYGNAGGEVITPDHFRYYTNANASYKYLFPLDNFFNLVDKNIASENYRRDLYLSLNLDPQLLSTSFSGSGIVYSFEEAQNNQAPIVRNVSMQYINATTLRCVANVTDAEGDPISNIYSLYLNKNGTWNLYAQGFSPDLSTYPLAVGEQAKCTVLPYAKNVYGTAVNSTAFTYNGTPGSSIQTVGYDDCGDPTMEPHLTQGSDFTAWGTQSAYSVSAHGTEVRYRYTGIDTQADYFINVTYYGAYNGVIARMQSLYADDALVHSGILIPDTAPQSYQYPVPKAAQQDGQITFRFVREQGDNAVVSEVRLLKSTNTTPQAPIISITSPANNSVVSGALEQVQLRILTDKFAVCRYKTSPFNFSAGTLFNATGQLQHNATVPLAANNTYYYICNSSAGVLSSMTLHRFTRGMQVFYDDLGNAANEPHLLQGTDFAGWGGSAPYTVSMHNDAIRLGYTVEPTAQYRVNITYFVPDLVGQERIMVATANGVSVHGNLSLPTSPTTYSFAVPAGTYASGKLNLTLMRVLGLNAVASEVWLYQVPETVPVPGLIEDFESGLAAWTSSTANRTLSASSATPTGNGSSMRVAFATGAEDFAFVSRTFAAPLDLSGYRTLEMDAAAFFNGSGSPRLGIAFTNATGGNMYPVNWVQNPAKSTWTHLYLNLSGVGPSATGIRLYVYRNRDNMTTGQPIAWHFDNLVLSNATGPAGNQTNGTNGTAASLPLIDDFENGLAFASSTRNVSLSPFARNGSNSMRISYMGSASEDFGFAAKTINSSSWEGYDTLFMDVFLNYTGLGAPKIGLVLSNASVASMYPTNWAQYPTRGAWQTIAFNISNLDKRAITKTSIYAYRNKDNLSAGFPIDYYIDNIRLGNATSNATTPPVATARLLVDDFDGTIAWSSAKRTITQTGFALNGSAMSASYTTGAEDFAFLTRNVNIDARAYTTLEFDVYLNYTGAGAPKLAVLVSNGTAALSPANWQQYPARNAWQKAYIDISSIDRQSIKAIQLYVYKNKDNMTAGMPISYTFDNMYLSNATAPAAPPASLVIEDFDDVSDWTSAKRNFTLSPFANNGSSMLVDYAAGAEDFGFLVKSFAVTDLSSYSKIQLDVYLNYSGSATPKMGLVLGNATTQVYPSNWAQYPAKGSWQTLTFDISGMQRTGLSKAYLYVYKNKDNLASGESVSYRFDNLRATN